MQIENGVAKVEERLHAMVLSGRESLLPTVHFLYQQRLFSEKFPDTLELLGNDAPRLFPFFIFSLKPPELFKHHRKIPEGLETVVQSHNFTIVMQSGH
jgi:hypothetical protein